MYVLQSRRDATRKGKQQPTDNVPVTGKKSNNTPVANENIANSFTTNETAVIGNLVIKILKNQSNDLRAEASVNQPLLGSGEESLQMEETIFSLHQVDPKRASTKLRGSKDYARYYINTNRNTTLSSANTSNDIDTTTLQTTMPIDKQSRGRGRGKVRFTPDRSPYDSELIQFAIFGRQATPARDTENMLSKLPVSRRRLSQRTRPGERIELIEFSSTVGKPSTEKNRVWQQNQLNHLNKNLVVHNMRRPYASFIPTSVLIRPTTIKSIEVTFTEKPWKNVNSLMEEIDEGKPLLVRSALRMAATENTAVEITGDGLIEQSSATTNPSGALSEISRRQLIAVFNSSDAEFHNNQPTTDRKSLNNLSEISTIVNVIEVTTIAPFIAHEVNENDEEVKPHWTQQPIIEEEILPRKEKRVNQAPSSPSVLEKLEGAIKKVSPESEIDKVTVASLAWSDNSQDPNEKISKTATMESTEVTTTTTSTVIPTKAAEAFEGGSKSAEKLKVIRRPFVASKDALPIPSSSIYSGKASNLDSSQSARSLDQTDTTDKLAQQFTETASERETKVIKIFDDTYSRAPFIPSSTARPVSYYYTRSNFTSPKITRVWTTARSSSWKPSSASTISSTTTTSTAVTTTLDQFIGASFPTSTVPPKPQDNINSFITQIPTIVLTKAGEEKSQLKSDEASSTNFTLFALIALGVAPVIAIVSYIVRTLMKNHDKEEGFIDGQPISPVVRLEQSDITGSEFFITDSKYGRGNLKFKSLLGEGNFGQVWKADIDDPSCANGVMVIAVKTEKKGKGLGGLDAEAEIMRKLGSHTNIIMLLEAYTEQGELVIIVITEHHENFITRTKKL